MLLYAIFTLLSGIVFLNGINDVSLLKLISNINYSLLPLILVRSQQNVPDAYLKNILYNCVDDNAIFPGNGSRISRYILNSSNISRVLHFTVSVQLLRGD